MMILAIDIGNTTIAIHVVQTGDNANTGSEDKMQILYTWKLPVIKDQTPADLDRAACELISKAHVEFIFDHVIISSVVPEYNDPVSAWASDFTGLEPVFVKYEKVPENLLQFAIPHPEKLGADRICDAVGAAGEYKLPVITVDLGSATTFNVVSEGRLFLGGIIAPGIRMGMRALSTGTSLLSETEINIPDHYIGKDTEECMLLGTAVGAAAMIDGMAERIEEELGSKATLVITGGNSVHAIPYIRHENVADSSLLIKGMCTLIQYKNIHKSEM